MGLDLGKLIKGVAQDVGHKIEKAANGAAHAVENAVKDTVHAAGTAVGELSKLPEHVQDTISTLTKKRKKTSLTVRIHNQWGSSIKNVSLAHRYLEKLPNVPIVGQITSLFGFCPQSMSISIYNRLYADKLDNERKSKSSEVEFYVYGGNTGNDYWIIKFEADGKIWSHDGELTHTLTHKDHEASGGEIVCHIVKDSGHPKIRITTPSSTECFALQGYPLPSDDARPVYAIAHKCNRTHDVAHAIHLGYNAVECDLEYDKKSGVMHVNHTTIEALNIGPGLKLDEWLDQAKEILDLYPDEFNLIIFDSKFAAELNAEESSKIFVDIRKRIRDKLNTRTRSINLIFSISKFEKRFAFDKIHGDLLDNEGIAIDESDNPEEVEKYFKSINCRNVWYGDGIFVAGTKKIDEPIKTGVRLRDEHKIIKKVYAWTLKDPDSIKRFFVNYKVDGVFTNPEGLFDGSSAELSLIRNERSIRLSKRGDKPFEVHK
ncbi:MULTISPECIES: hypothetical protein [Burkholderia]|jgi:hypothetical protein|nr:MULTISPECIES: hypothetical protein [Burkholderia]MCG0577814.1 hypothetical protein [Burkholderia cenocepacia]MCW3691694.1 hypothetical protein [Burkholderia cenocepacia]MDF3115559.1 hypothetical protein [Burkholderia semiarida]MDR8073983.1 hypothetical protein [Burkholderia cenocepacia]MDR8075525.1 hypothetical protein [Burkholderia cenocepacia]